MTLMVTRLDGLFGGWLELEVMVVWGRKKKLKREKGEGFQECSDTMKKLYEWSVVLLNVSVLQCLQFIDTSRLAHLKDYMR